MTWRAGFVAVASLVFAGCGTSVEHEQAPDGSVRIGTGAAVGSGGSGGAPAPSTGGSAPACGGVESTSGTGGASGAGASATTGGSGGALPDAGRKMSDASMGGGGARTSSGGGGTSGDGASSGGASNGGASSGGTGGTSGTGGLGAGNVGGSGGSQTGGILTLGASCFTESDCVEGLSCVESNSVDFNGGGPANGLCTVACSTDDDCTPFGENSQCLGVDDTNAFCFEGCTIGDQDPTKCHERLDMACNEPVDQFGNPISGSRVLCAHVPERLGLQGQEVRSFARHLRRPSRRHRSAPDWSCMRPERHESLRRRVSHLSGRRRGPR